jgi:hypothetical protein
VLDIRQKCLGLLLRMSLFSRSSVASVCRMYMRFLHQEDRSRLRRSKCWRRIFSSRPCRLRAIAASGSSEQELVDRTALRSPTAWAATVTDSRRAMTAPDWPRLPSGYHFDPHAAQLAVVDAHFDLDDSESDVKTRLGAAVKAATALALAAHAGEDRYAFVVANRGAVQGELDRGTSLGNLLAQVGKDNSAGQAAEGNRVVVDAREEDNNGAQDEAQQTPLSLVLVKRGERDSSFTLRLSFDRTILPQTEAQWFVSHVGTAATKILASDPSAAIGAINLAPPGEIDTLRRYASCPDTIHEPDAYPSHVQSLASFFSHAAEKYPEDLALHFIPDPTNPRNGAVDLSYAQLSHLAQYLANQLIASSSTRSRSVRDRRKRGQQVVPVVVDKSPEMVVSMLAISLAGYGYLALEPSFPEDRKRGICAELQEKGMLAPVAIVQQTGDELDRWAGWASSEAVSASQDPQKVFECVLDPRQALSPLLERLAHDPQVDLQAEFPVRAANPDEEERALPNDIAYIIYTSGTTGKPKGIVVEQQNVTAFLR